MIQNSSTALKLTGQSMSSRGPATDPESLYSRVRSVWIDGLFAAYSIQSFHDKRFCISLHKLLL